VPRPVLIRSEIHPYHITSRCNNKEFFPIPLEQVWRIMLNQLLRIHQNHRLAIHAFVLMGNHFHLLCHTPDANIDEVMHSLLRTSSLMISKRANSINHLWGSRYKWSLIDNQSYYYQVYRYIYQNPLRVGLVSRVEDYRFSTIHLDPPFPLHSFISLSFGGREGELRWLNERLNENAQDQIKRGLRRSMFDLNKRKVKSILNLSIPQET